MGNRVHDKHRQRYQAVLSKNRYPVDRREFLAVNSVLGGGLIAGCLGDDDGETDEVVADDSNDVDDTDGEVSDDDDDEVEDASDDEREEIQRFDVTLWKSHPEGGPLPADSQYSPYSGAPNPLWQWRFKAPLASRSFGDDLTHSILLVDIDYQPGILEITLRDDVYWWSGKQLDAADVVMQLGLEDMLWGGEDLNANPDIVSFDQVDDRTVRLALADTWTEEFALEQSINGQSVLASTDYNAQWVEEFDDAGGDMDVIGEIRADMDESRVDDDENLEHLFYFPFEFRLNEDLGDVTELYWDLELVPEKNGNMRAWVDRINYTTIRADLDPEIGWADAWQERLIEGKSPSAVSPILDEEMLDEFEYEVKEFFRPIDAMGWNFNNDVHPTDEPRFRRSWNFATDREIWVFPDDILHRRTLQEHTHPFLTDERLEQWVSDDVIAAFTDYGTTSEWDRAEEELLIAGFEQDADGFWLNKETGEQIDIEMAGPGHIDDYLTDISDWVADMETFGIQMEYIGDYNDDWTVSAAYVGGLLPEVVFEQVYGDGEAWGVLGPNLGETVAAPPVGETDAPEDDWVEYDVRAMASRLPVTGEEEAWQRLVDELTWIANQIVPRTVKGADVQQYIFNTEYWHAPDPEEAPELFTALPWRAPTINGMKSWVGDEEAEPVF